MIFCNFNFIHRNISLWPSIHQHGEELNKSGISYKIYDGNPDKLSLNHNEIFIIDIHKLTSNKKGKGVSLDISSFEDKNVVFIDEGHKGQKSEDQVWKNLRETLGTNGLTIEYSATFGQIISGNKVLLDEYGKSIIFDYSYKYFYADGFGKDFYIFNLQETIYSDQFRDLLFTAGLLIPYDMDNKKAFRNNNYKKQIQALTLYYE